MTLVTFQSDALVQSYNPLKKQTLKRETLRNEAVNVAVLEEVNPPTLSDVGDQDNLSTFPIYNFHHKVNPLETEVCINKETVVMEIDTGAGLSLISQETYSTKFGYCQLQPTDIQLRTYGGQPIPVLGLLNVTVQYESQSAILPLLVVVGNGPNLLGRNWLSTIKLNWKTICHLQKLSVIYKHHHHR